LLHGNYKKDSEIETALRLGVGRIVLDSEYEADTLDRVAKRLGVRARAMLRITPGIEAHVHEMVQVGKLDTKFGVPLAGGAAKKLIALIAGKRGIEFVGIHCHIGSQILDTDPYKLVVKRVAEFIAELRDELGIEVRDLDIGGGVPGFARGAQGAETRAAAAHDRTRPLDSWTGGNDSLHRRPRQGDSGHQKLCFR
jgi:diaminopimelate decarboxylase